MIKVLSKKGNAVNIREFPDVKSKVVGTITGASFKVLIEWSATYNGFRWAKVDADGKFGYIREDVARIESDLSGEKLSDHLTVSEFLKSEKARMLGVDNSFSNQDHFLNAKFLAVKVFEPLRKFIAKAILVSSGYRAPKVNKDIGGSATSQHCRGEAMDIDSAEVGMNKRYFDFIKKKLDYDQLIWEFGNASNPDWVHVSIRRDGKNRKQVLRAIKNKNGSTSYVPYK